MTDAELRKLRDAIYGIPITDHEWEICKANWAKPEEVQWLKENQPKKLTV